MLFRSAGQAAVAWQAYLEGRPADAQPAAPAFDLADAAAGQAPVADWDDAVGRLAVQVDRVAVELRADAGRPWKSTIGRIAALAARALADLDCSERDEPEDA